MMHALDPVRLKREQKDNWNIAAAGRRIWSERFERGAYPVSKRLVELAEIGPGHRVLDVATGDGEPAVTAARRVAPDGLVIAIDQAPGMISAARDRAARLGVTNIEFREADAETLDIPETGFDAVLCRWGLMFLPDLTGALRRMRELLTEHGRIATAVWDRPETVPMITMGSEAIREILNQPPSPPGSLEPYRLSDPAALEKSFRDAGFADFRIEPITVTFEFESPEAFARFRFEFTGRFRKMIEALDLATRNRIAAATISAARQFVNGGIVRIPNQAFCAVARK
ncbi:MAG: class I SAM-dependent methyltransferase [Candidatus Binataceae bacterium]